MFEKVKRLFRTEAPIDVSSLVALQQQRMGQKYREDEVRIKLQSKLLREIMRKNFFGLEEAVKYLGVYPSDLTVDDLSELPFTTETLSECRDTHVLTAVCQISIMDVRTASARSEAMLFHDAPWYWKQGFASKVNMNSWQLVRKTPVNGSTAKVWDEQQVLLPDNEYTPSARIMTYSIIGHYLASHERLFGNVFVRTSDRDSGNYPVDVGCFGPTGLQIMDWGGARRANVGLAAARKPDNA